MQGARTDVRSERGARTISGQKDLSAGRR